MSRWFASIGWGVLAFAVLLPAAGCKKQGPNLAPVTGVVTLHGKPVWETEVMFYPEGEKSPSVGRTDKDGHYTLRYRRGVEGGTIGMNVVKMKVITEMTKGPQLIPQKYITGSDLRREVKAGKNEINFELSELDN